MKNSTTPFIRYHYEIGFPKNVGDMALSFFESFTELNTTLHSLSQLADETHGVIPRPCKADLMHPNNTLVEFYEDVDNYGLPSRVMRKVLMRCHHLDNRRDFSYVVSRDGYIVSAWSNDKADKHRLIQRDVYFSNFYNEEVDMPDVLRDEDDSNEE